MTKIYKHIASCILLVFLLILAIGSSEDDNASSSKSPVPPSAETLRNWPPHNNFEQWTAGILRTYNDPEIKCNKITGIDTPTKGAIRVKGIWCAQDQGIGSPGMNAAIRLIGKTINTSFRNEFPSFSGPLAISIWDTSGKEAFGSIDWE